MKKLLLIQLALFFGLCTFIGCSKEESNKDNSKQESVEEKAFRLVNEYRKSKGKSELINMQVVYDQAKKHSENMASGKIKFSHDGFSDRVNIISKTTRISDAAENVASNKGHSDPAQVAFDGWESSKGHNGNMLGDFTHTGLAVVANKSGTYYFTQIFVKL